MKSGEFYMPQVDYRAKLVPKPISPTRTRSPSQSQSSTRSINQDGMTEVFGPDDSGNILQPLRVTRGVLFPYTPEVTTGSNAEYDQQGFVHSIYGYNAYVRSFPSTIGISAEFTAQSIKEAYYMLAVMHFFRTVTKSYFGLQTYNKSGTPPPVMLFSYLGDYVFSNVPVIIKTFEYTLPADIDYVPVNTSNFSPDGKPSNIDATGQTTKQGWTYLPTHLQVNIQMEHQYTPYLIRQTFNLDKFRTGHLMDQGWI